MPQVMETHHSYFGGNFVASCRACGAVCAYWDEDDLDEQEQLLCHCDEEGS
jgi:hypothetical protein